MGKVRLSDSADVWALAWPSLVTSGAIAARQFTDAVMVGRLGTDHLAAIMPAQQVLFLFLSFGAGLASALNTCASQGQTRSHSAEAGLFCWQAIWIALIAGGALSQLHFLSGPIMALLRHDPEVYKLEVEYISLAFWALIPHFVAITLANFFFAIRRPIFPMCMALAYMAINVVANRVLIFGLGEMITPMGIRGVAVGNIIASCFFCVGLFAVFFFSKSLSDFRSRRPSVCFSRIRELLKIGPFGGGIDVVDILFWNIAILFLIGGFGSDHLAAASVMVVVIELILFPMDGMLVALTTVVGLQIGARNFEAAYRTVSKALKVCLGFTGIAAAVCYFGGGFIFDMISGDPQVKAVGLECLWALPIILLFSVWCYVTDSGLAGAGDARYPFMVVLISNFVIILCGGMWAAERFAMFGSIVIWICVAINRGVIGAWISWRWHGGKWRDALPKVESR